MSVADFKTTADDTRPKANLTKAQVSEVETVPTGGRSFIYVNGSEPDRLYTVGIRPLFPDDLKAEGLSAATVVVIRSARRPYQRNSQHDCGSRPRGKRRHARPDNGAQSYARKPRAIQAKSGNPWIRLACRAFDSDERDLAGLLLRSRSYEAVRRK